MTKAESQFMNFIETTDEDIFDMQIAPNGIEPEVTNEPTNIVFVYTNNVPDSTGYIFGGIRINMFERMKKYISTIKTTY
jgi:hypothetical protein